MYQKKSTELNQCLFIFFKIYIFWGAFLPLFQKERVYRVGNRDKREGERHARKEPQARVEPWPPAFMEHDLTARPSAPHEFLNFSISRLLS